jgi:hypothetical protein
MAPSSSGYCHKPRLLGGPKINDAAIFAEFAK